MERWALTPPFHPYPDLLRNPGGLFSVALSVGMPRGITARVYPEVRLLASAAPGYAASRPMVFGLSSPPNCFEGAILRPSKTVTSINYPEPASNFLPAALLKDRVRRWIWKPWLGWP